MENFTALNKSIQATHSTAELQCFTFTESITLKILMTIAYGVVITTSIVGNTILALAYFKNQNLRNTYNCCIMNIVLADLLITLVYMPRMVGRIVFGLEWLVKGTQGNILCIIVSMSQEISICVSILTVVVIAFERFCAVAFPLRVVVSKRLSIGLLCGTWLVSLAARSPMFYGVKTVRFESGELGCFWIATLSFPTEKTRKFYHHFMLIVFYGLPLVCIITLYTVIMISLRRRKALIDNITRNRALAINKKVTKMILAVITAFLLCWLLYFLVIPLEEFWNVVIPCQVYFLRIFLGHVNSACNPIICLAFSDNYRNGIKIRRGQLKLKRPARHLLQVSPTRDRSRSNRALERPVESSQVQHVTGNYNASSQYDENHV